MLTAEDIKLLSDLMDQKLEPINNRLDKVDQRLDKIEERLEVVEENTEVTRAVVNELVEWVDYNFRDQYPFPVDKKKAI